MKKIIIMFVVLLMLVSLVSSLEQTSHLPTNIEPEIIEKRLGFFEKIGSYLTVGAIVVEEPSGQIGNCNNFPTGGLNIFSKKYSQTTVIAVGSKCSDDSLVRVYECNDGTTCSDRLKVAEAYRIGGVSPKFTEWNPDNYFAYLCYDCGGITTPDFDAGYCLSQEGLCSYVTKSSEYTEFNCIKPSIDNLWQDPNLCVEEKPSEIVCYTTCKNNFYEEKKVTANFCRDVGLLSVPPSNCISPESEGCTYFGNEYDAGEQFCYQNNVGRCMGDEKIDVIIHCSIDCENAKCTEEEVEGKVCCRTYEFWRGDQAVYSYKFEDECPIGLNVREVDNDYCMGDKSPENPPEIDEETEEGVPEEKDGVEKCSIPIGEHCKPLNRAGLDDSGQDNLCETGWCQDIIGVGGRCAKVGTFSDGKRKSGFEPHPDCVATAQEFELDLCKWTTWAPDWFGTQCATAYTLIIGGFIGLMIFVNLMKKD